MQKAFITIISTFFLFNASIAQDSASVLFIGNSYTYVNDLPLLVSSLANSLGDVVTYDSQTPGGTTFANHAANATTYTKINSSNWDYVVLQAQSQEPSFSDAQVNSQTLPYAEQLADSVYANNFCSEVLMFMTWGRENGDPQWAPISTFDGMNARLRSAYMRMADSVQGSVSPVGSAWKYVRDNYPTIGLYAGDGSHPSLAGSYLAACTFYAAVFRESPIGAPFISTLSAQDAADLQYAASITVLDSLDQWNLRPVSEHTQADFSFNINGSTVDFTNLSTKAINYYWDFGDLNTSTLETPSNTYSSSGTYTVTLIAESPCDTDTIEYEVIINIMGLDEIPNSFKLLYEGYGNYHIKGLTVTDEIEVYNMEGRKVPFVRTNSNVNLSGNKHGLYFMKVNSKGGNWTLRVPYMYE